MSEAPVTEPTTTEPAAAAPTPQEPASDAPKAESAKGSGLPTDVDALHTMIRDLRRENANRRTEPKQAAEAARTEIAQTIGKALGLVADDAPVDPAELTRQIETSQAEANRARVELAVYRSAASAGGDPAALLDSTSFLASLAGIDPTDSSAMSGAIAKAVETNPRLGVAPAAPAAPAPNPAQGAASPGPTAPVQLGTADLARMTPAQISEARQKGQLADLLAGKHS